MKLLLVTVAVYRISHMIAIEDGPFNVFYRIREYVRKKFGADHWVYEGFNCPLCISFWLAMVGAWIMVPALISEFVILWLGMAGAILVIHRFLYRT